MTNPLNQNVKLLDGYLRELSVGCPNRITLSPQVSAPLQESIYILVPMPLYRLLDLRFRVPLFESVYWWAAA